MSFFRSASVIAAALFFSYSSTRSVKVCCRSTSARRACSKVFGLSYWASLLSAKGFSYPGFQSGKRRASARGDATFIRTSSGAQCVQSSVFLLMLSCMAFREQTGIPPLAGRDVGSRSIRSTKIEPPNKPQGYKHPCRLAASRRSLTFEISEPWRNGTLRVGHLTTADKSGRSGRTCPGSDR